MKTVFKKVGAWLTIGLFSLFLCTVPKKAKAVDDNTPIPSESFNSTFINMPLDFYFNSLTGGTDYYYPLYMRFTIFNTPDPNLNGSETYDYMYHITIADTNTITNFTPDIGSLSLAFVHKDTNPTSTNRDLYTSFNIKYVRETSDNISGVMTSYVIDSVSYANALHVDDGFSITFNFEVGYKKYIFYNELALSCIFFSSDKNPLPRTYNINVMSGNDIKIYQTAKQEGYTEGYKTGYSTGEDAGKKSGYSTGYTKGYNDGRIAPDYSFKEFFIGLGDAFVTVYTSMLNYEFLGVNIAGLIGTVVVIITIMIVVKLILKK